MSENLGGGNNQPPSISSRKLQGLGLPSPSKQELQRYLENAPQENGKPSQGSRIRHRGSQHYQDVQDFVRQNKGKVFDNFSRPQHSRHLERDNYNQRWRDRGFLKQTKKAAKAASGAVATAVEEAVTRSQTPRGFRLPSSTLGKIGAGAGAVSTIIAIPSLIEEVKQASIAAAELPLLIGLGLSSFWNPHNRNQQIAQDLENYFKRKRLKEAAENSWFPWQRELAKERLRQMDEQLTPQRNEIQPEKTPFKGGQSAGVMYSVTLRRDNPPGSFLENQTKNNVVGPIQGLGSYQGLSNNDGQYGIQHGNNQLTLVSPNYAVEGNPFPTGKNRYTITSITRQDGQPDTGGNPTPTQPQILEPYKPLPLQNLTGNRSLEIEIEPGIFEPADPSHPALQPSPHVTKQADRNSNFRLPGFRPLPELPGKLENYDPNDATKDRAPDVPYWRLLTPEQKDTLTPDLRDKPLEDLDKTVSPGKGEEQKEQNEEKPYSELTEEEKAKLTPEEKVDRAKKDPAFDGWSTWQILDGRKWDTPTPFAPDDPRIISYRRSSGDQQRAFVDGSEQAKAFDDFWERRKSQSPHTTLPFTATIPQEERKAPTPFKLPPILPIPARVPQQNRTPTKDNEKKVGFDSNPNKNPTKKPTKQPNVPPDIQQTPVDQCKNGCGGKIIGNQEQIIDGQKSMLEKFNDALDSGLLKKTWLNTETINDKMGDKIPGGLGGFMKKAWDMTRADKILNALNTILLVHNAAMLSRNLGESMGDLTSLILNNIPWIKDATGGNIDVNEILGKSLEGLIKSIVGEEIYSGAKEKFNKANRIISTAMGLASAVQNMMDSALNGLNTIGRWIAQFQNRTQEQGFMDDNSWPWRNENVNFKNPFARLLEKTENLEDATDSLYNVISSGVEVIDSYKEAVEATTQLKKDLKDFEDDKKDDEKDKTNESQSPEIDKVNLVEGQQN